MIPPGSLPSCWPSWADPPGPAWVRQRTRPGEVPVPRQISARRGLIITGGGGTGKTTAITQLGKAHELSVRHRDPDHSRIPVAYVTVPPAATPRTPAAEFARFLGLPVSSRLNMTDITNAVCSVLCQVGCDLVLVDEITTSTSPPAPGPRSPTSSALLWQRMSVTPAAGWTPQGHFSSRAARAAVMLASAVALSIPRPASAPVPSWSSSSASRMCSVPM
jgi:hypothetical protein